MFEIAHSIYRRLLPELAGNLVESSLCKSLGKPSSRLKMLAEMKGSHVTDE